jgi:shikimate kinase
MNTNIFLIGMPSSGKSTLGRKLAAQMGYNFLETDDIIVNQQGKSITKIFEEDGENRFRVLERDLLHSIGPKQRLVVSTGGGMPCFHGNINYMLTNGLVVFINVPIEALYERLIASNKNDRPLIQLNNRTQLLENLRTRHSQRLPIYSQAPIQIKENFTWQHLAEIVRQYLDRNTNHTIL